MFHSVVMVQNLRYRRYSVSPAQVITQFHHPNGAHRAGGRQMASASDREYAKRLVNHNLLEQKPLPSGMWQNLRREDVAAGLKSRVDSPDLINQGNTYLCGMAAVAHEIAKSDPVHYAWMGLCLFMMGRARLSRASSEELKPGVETRRSAIPNVYVKGGMRPMNHADWLVLASMRDSLNTILNYSKSEAGFLGNIPLIGHFFKELHPAGWNTTGDVIKALKLAGWGTVVDRVTGPVRTAGAQNAEDAADYRERGYSVILLINSRLLRDERAVTTAAVGTSDHWVGLVAGIELNRFWRSGGSSELDRWGARARIWNYGTTVDIPNKGGYHSLRTFLQHYYGFVAFR
jgi:hypothetical protein